MLSGDVVPTKYFEALSEADEFCKELDEVHGLRTRNAELEAENTELADRLRDVYETHRITLNRLAIANAQLKRMAADR
jgi:hypothetical protein